MKKREKPKVGYPVKVEDHGRNENWVRVRGAHKLRENFIIGIKFSYSETDFLIVPRCNRTWLEKCENDAVLTVASHFNH